MLQKDLKLIFHDRKLIGAILIILMITSVGLSFGKSADSGEPVKAGFCDYDNSEYSNMLFTYFSENDTFSFYLELIKGSEEELDRMLEKGEISLYLVIPENFIDKVNRIENIPIKAVVDSTDAASALLYDQLLTAYGKYISSVEVACQSLIDVMVADGYSYEERTRVNDSISIDLLLTAIGKDSFYNTTIIERLMGVSNVNYYICSLFALLILYLGFFTGLSFLRERLTNSAQRLKTIGNGAPKLAFSKLAAHCIVFLPLIFLALVLLESFGEFDFEISAYFILVFSLVGAQLFFLIPAGFIKTTAGYGIFGNMLILLMIIVGGGILPVMYMPQSLSSIAAYSPVYWFIKCMIWGI